MSFRICEKQLVGIAASLEVHGKNTEAGDAEHEHYISKRTENGDWTFRECVARNQESAGRIGQRTVRVEDSLKVCSAKE